MSKKYKIGFLFDDSLDAPDGVQQYILTIGPWLAERGHEVHYLVGDTKRTDIANVHSLSKNINVRFNKNKLSIPLPVSARTIRQFYSENKLDILHVQLPYSPQFAQKVIRYAPPRTAVVGTFHILPFGRLQAWGARLLGYLLRPSLSRFDQIVSVSPAASNFAKNTMGIASSVVPNAVNLSRFKTERPPKSTSAASQSTRPLRIVFLGRLVERKGCQELLRAVQLLNEQQKLKPVKVIIGGSGPQMPKLQAYVHKYGLQTVVEFKGQLSESEKVSFLNSADIAVLPSLSGESFGIVVVEAIASGAGVVVGGDNPGYRYVLASTPDLLVDPRNTAALAQMLKRLIDDSEFRSKAGAIQRDHIKQFDVKYVGKKIEKMYAQAWLKHGKV